MTIPLDVRSESAAKPETASSALQVEQFDAVKQALEQYRIGNAGFGDCRIAALAAVAGCAYTMVFGKAASKLPGMRLLSNA